MTTYHIYSKAGPYYGAYVGATPRQAFEAMCADGLGEYGAPEVGTEEDWLVVLVPAIDAAVRTLALALWEEQLDAGLGCEGETVDPERLDDWLANRCSINDLVAAAYGDAAALARVRTECGLPVLS